MNSFKIKLKSVNEAQIFANITSELSINADICSVLNSHHVVPADSVIGLFTLNLNDELIVTPICDDIKYEEYIDKCSQWIIS